jgi:hypothetical protein
VVLILGGREGQRPREIDGIVLRRIFGSKNDFEEWRRLHNEKVLLRYSC